MVLGPAAVWLGTRFDPLGRAQAAYDRHDYRVALRAARDHLQTWPRDQRAALMSARCLTRLGRVPEAEDYYRRAGALEADDLQSRAYGLVRLNEPTQAAEVYERLLKLRPNEVLALKRLAAVHMGLKQWPKVLALSERLSAIPSEEVAGSTMAGIGHHESKHYSQAIASFERVLQLDPELKVMPLPASLFWNNFALDLMGQGRSSEARAYLSRALTHGDDAGLMELVGLTYHLEGKPEQAERCWRQAVNWDPGNVDAWLELGRLAMNRKQWNEAVSILEPVVARAPEMVEPVYSLSLAYRQLGKTAEAERYRLRADQLRRSKPAVGGMGEMPADDTAGAPSHPRAKETAR